MTTTTDFLGNPIEVGATVVYPAMSGRSCQLAVAEVLDFTARTTAEYEEAKAKRGESWADSYARAGELTRVRLIPTGKTSRYRQHYSAKFGKPKIVTLTANAPSIVVVPKPKDPEDE